MFQPAKSDKNTYSIEVPTPKSAHYDLLVEHNVAGLFSLKNETICYSNAAFATVLDSTIDEIQGTSILQQVIDTDRIILQVGLEKMIRGEEQQFSKDLKRKAKDGSTRYFSLHLKVHSREQDEVFIIGASKDATSRVERSIELAKTRARYEALYRNLPDGIIIYNYKDEKIMDFNEAALNILGYEKPEELFAVNRFQFIPKSSPYFPGLDLHEETRNHGLRVMNGEAFSTPGVINGKDDKQVLTQVNVVPTFYETGEAYVIFKDITSKILNKIARKQSEQKYRTIFENSHEAIIYTDIKTQKPIICNDNALQLFGVSSFESFSLLRTRDFAIDREVEGKSTGDYLMHMMQKALLEGKATMSHWIKKQTGQVIRISGVLIGDQSDPKHPKVISFWRDITHLHQAQEALNNKNEELKKYIDSNLQLENFAYFASHDLQTPLRSITSFTQILQRKLKGRLAEEEQEYMDFIISSSKNMRSLINDLLSYSRVNTTKINIQPTNLKATLQELCVELDSSIKEKGADIIMHNIPELIHTDATKMRQVFQNLITNALKFTAPDVKPLIHITCQEEANQWLFSVKDNGIGIAPEFREKIFLLFKRLHGHSDYEGTGIGLAMVKKIIEQHEGRIWLDSKEGEGATFWFTIHSPAE